MQNLVKKTIAISAQSSLQVPGTGFISAYFIMDLDLEDLPY